MGCNLRRQNSDVQLAKVCCIQRFREDRSFRATELALPHANLIETSLYFVEHTHTYFFVHICNTLLNFYNILLFTIHFI